MDSSFRTFKREEALSDIHQLLRILTEVHPDPFRNLGSQVKFYTKVEEILSSLEETIDLSQLNMIAMRIIALLGDCHTQVTQLFAKSRKVWLEFKPIDKMIILTGVYENKFRWQLLFQAFLILVLPHGFHLLQGVCVQSEN